LRQTHADEIMPTVKYHFDDFEATFRAEKILLDLENPAPNDV
jgi:hypothetical protein